RVVLLPDSVPVAVVSLLPKAGHDSLYRPPPAAPDSAAPKPAPAKRPVAAGADTIPPSRTALFTSLLLRVAEPWRPEGKYVIEIDSVRNANGAAAQVRGPLEVPKAKVDSTATKPDSARAPADSAPPPKPSQ
ncbi:MAG TPA: hypothetical protein PK948_08245, partial [Gemmatimonadales bacterium]|nr:hypothetical protein [Gemmatimonadales bacterium]